MESCSSIGVDIFFHKVFMLEGSWRSWRSASNWSRFYAQKTIARFNLNKKDTFLYKVLEKDQVLLDKGKGGPKKIPKTISRKYEILKESRKGKFAEKSVFDP